MEGAFKGVENRFSILMLLETSEDIEDTISNLVKSNIEIILLDNTEGNKAGKELEEVLVKYPTIIYVDAKNKSKNEAYNIGLKKATGDYISFAEQGIKYEKGAIASVQKHIQKEHAKIICLKPCYMQSEEKKTYKKCSSSNKNLSIDLIKSPLELRMILPAYFFHKDYIKQMDETMYFEDAKIKLLLEILLQHPSYYLINHKSVYYTIPKEDDIGTNNMQNEKQWYQVSLTQFVIPFLTQILEKVRQVPTFIQEAMLYYIYEKYNCNLNDRNKMLLDKEEVQAFLDSTAIALTYIDTDLIIEKDKYLLFKMPRWLAYQFVLLKNSKLNVETNIVIDDKKIYLQENKKEYLVSELEQEKLNMYAINFEDKVLNMDFSISMQDFLKRDDIEVIAKYNGKTIKAIKTECYPLVKVYGVTIAKKIFFHMDIPLEQKGIIEFYVIYQEKEYKMNIRYEKPQARLTNSRYSYWKINDDYYLCNKRERLVIERKRIFSGIVKELKFFAARIVRTNHLPVTLKYFTLRLAYWIVKPFYKNRQIWITYDKLYKAGDNGEYIYRHVKENHSDVKMYYVIKKEALDYERLKREENANLLLYGTFKHKLMSLLATVILATHANAISYCGFSSKKSKLYICDLFDAEIVCIQHGLTIQEIAQYQNRLVDNTKLYCCASKYEVHNLLNNAMYDFQEKHIEMTGLARYDGLKDKNQKQILITPTWRRYLTLPSPKYGEARQHNDSFKNSDYFKIYNTLINDERLISTAKEYGYKIIYVLHPCTSSQIDDYDRNDYVELLAATDNVNYEKMLTEASLMVTDYSGVQFDFAYMRKPIVYYHPDELPPHYETSELDYETMGFGPICKTNDKIVNVLCEYMKQDCKIEEEYIRRANDFFAYDDYNNCERIYQSIQNKLIKKEQKNIEEKGAENEYSDYLCRR